MGVACCFRRCMAERRHAVKGSAEYRYLTKAARKYVWMINKVPPREWAERMEEYADD